MRLSKYFLCTQKNISLDVNMISHKLMLRSGMIQKNSRGIYTWLPIGLRVLYKIENIIRNRMNEIGAIEIAMPFIQSADLWKASGRWNQYGEELIKIVDRKKQQFVLGSTYEELVTDLVRQKINSCKYFPFIIYQIQTKFRDEIRPFGGVMRAREFKMKDAYSFHLSEKSLSNTYNLMRTVYLDIFRDVGLQVTEVSADNGIIGGTISHEFHAVIDDNFDKDGMTFLRKSKKKKNSVKDKISLINSVDFESLDNMQIVFSKKIYSLSKGFINKFSFSKEKILKIIFVAANINCKYSWIGLGISYDDELSIAKLENIEEIKKPLVYAAESDINKLYYKNISRLNPIEFKCPLFIDKNVVNIKNFIIKSRNVPGKYFINLNWGRDISLPIVKDLCKVILIKDNILHNKQKLLSVRRIVEVGHIFQVGCKYSSIMKLGFKINSEKKCNVFMGSYGIGISRVIAAIIEQSHTSKGIIWKNEEIAPFHLVILAIDIHKNNLVKNISCKLYEDLKKLNIDVLFDDRNESPGIMFSDRDLLGIPHSVIVSPRLVILNSVEYNHYTDNENTFFKKIVNINDIVNFLCNVFSLKK